MDNKLPESFRRLSAEMDMVQSTKDNLAPLHLHIPEPKFRPGDVADFLHVPRPVGAKLKAHGDAADHAQCEGQGKDLDPELVGVHPMLLASGHKAGFEKQQHPAERNADRREQDVKGDVGRKLDAG